MHEQKRLSKVLHAHAMERSWLHLVHVCIHVCMDADARGIALMERSARLWRDILQVYMTRHKHRLTHTHTYTYKHTSVWGGVCGCVGALVFVMCVCVCL